MGNRLFGTNCGNTTWTHDCCGGAIGFQEICGDTESCFYEERVDDEIWYCEFDGSREESQWIWIFLGIVGGCLITYLLYYLYSYTIVFDRCKRQKNKQRQSRASESEVKNLLDKGFKL